MARKTKKVTLVLPEEQVDEDRAEQMKLQRTIWRVEPLLVISVYQDRNLIVLVE